MEALRYQRSVIKTGWDEGHTKGFKEGEAKGRAEGIAEGRAEGEKEKAKEIAKKMKDMGLPVKEIAQYTQLNPIRLYFSRYLSTSIPLPFLFQKRNLLLFYIVYACPTRMDGHTLSLLSVPMPRLLNHRV